MVIYKERGEQVRLFFLWMPGVLKVKKKRNSLPVRRKAVPLQADYCQKFIKD
jgi:hypothetical protein